MIPAELTKPTGTAKSRAMRRIHPEGIGQFFRLTRVGLVLAAGALTLGGCISVNAPDKPIVIELNINIKQEVIYRLAADAGNTIESNPDIF